MFGEEEPFFPCQIAGNECWEVAVSAVMPTDRWCINLEEPIRLPSPHRINFSVCLSIRLFVCLSVCLSVIYENTLNFHIGIKIRVSTWSFLSVFHPLRIPIPMYKKKVRVQQENSLKITICFCVLPTKFLHYVPYTHGALMGWRNFSKTAGKKFSSPRAAGVPGGTN